MLTDTLHCGVNERGHRIASLTSAVDKSQGAINKGIAIGREDACTNACANDGDNAHKSDDSDRLAVIADLLASEGGDSA
jgi:hypothetical protein